MKHDPDIGRRSMLLATAIILLALCAHMIQADTGTCGGASTTFAPLGGLSVGASTFPAAACSDGVNFWIVRSNSSDIVRF